MNKTQKKLNLLTYPSHLLLWVTASNVSVFNYLKQLILLISVQFLVSLIFEITLFYKEQQRLRGN